jgi:hypothetical protein
MISTRYYLVKFCPRKRWVIVGMALVVLVCKIVGALPVARENSIISLSCGKCGI